MRGHGAWLCLYAPRETSYDNIYFVNREKIAVDLFIMTEDFSFQGKHQFHRKGN